jgi:signal peptidase II
MKKNLFYYDIILLLVALDQATKWLVFRYLSLYNSVTVLPGFFNLTHIRNKGAIFGAFSHVNSRAVLLLLTVASLIALALVLFYFFRTPASERGMKLALALILAGALGNLIDRVFRGYVIDFLDFHVRGQHWPYFNVADSAITVGALLLFIFLWRKKPECTPSSSASGL